MAVELRDPATFECRAQSRIERVGKGRVARVDRREPPDGGHDGVWRVRPLEPWPRRQTLERALERQFLALRPAGSECREIRRHG